MSRDDRLQVGVLFGGRSGEHAVSLMSARSVLGALSPDKYQVHQIGITDQGAWLYGEQALEAMESGQTGGLVAATILPDPTRFGLRRLEASDQGAILDRLASLDVVFPVLHGTFGEDGTLQGLLEMAEVAYVGAGVLASSLAMDKGVFKDIMRAHAIPVLDSLVVTRREIAMHVDRVLQRAQQVGPYPLFTKPANMGSSVGVSKCRSRADLLEGLMEAALYDRRILVEKGIEGREIEVSVLGNEQPEASIAGEIVPSADFYTYDAKYHDERSELLIPAPLPASQRELVKDYVLRAYKAIDCAGMARVDFLMDKSTDELYLSEMNTIPGFTRISMYPKLWEASGLPYPALADRLIDLALERRTEQAQTTRKFERGQTA